MKRSVLFILTIIMLIISKYVISGAYYDYTLQKRELKKIQLQLIDANKRHIAELENYRSANYLFSQKEALGLKEVTPDTTIIVTERDNVFTEAKNIYSSSE